MDQDMYRAPMANTAETLGAQNEFYVVAIKKLIIFMVLTFGLYAVYWNYKHWRLYKLKNNADVIAPMRALFSIFFIYSLYTKINLELEDKNSAFEWGPGQAATMYVLFNVIANIFDVIPSIADSIELTLLVMLISYIAIVWSMIRGQRAANIVGDDLEGESNCGYSWREIAFLILGGLFWVLALIGWFETTVGIPV